MVRAEQPQSGVLGALEPVAAKDPKLDFELPFLIRPDSSDAAAVEEVVTKHTYRKGFAGTDYVFNVAPGERWLDLGANIGTFSVWAAAQGCQVVAFEPERITFRVLQKNVAAFHGVTPQRYAVVSGQFHHENDGKAVLSLGHKGSEWRNTLMKKKSELAQEVPTVPIGLALRSFGPFDGIKADIEGAELAMFDDPAWLGQLREAGVRKMVFEYHFDIDRDVARFRQRMAKLGERFGAIPEDAVTYDWFPPSRIVYCWKDKA
jgi:FkbM family methyltransferase